MPNCLRLRSGLEFLRLNDTTIVFARGFEYITLRGRSVAEVIDSILPLLQHPVILDDVLAATSHIASDVTTSALQLLIDNGVLEESSDTAADSISRNKFSDFIRDPGRADYLTDTVVAIIGEGAIARAVASSIASTPAARLRLLGFTDAIDYVSHSALNAGARAVEVHRGDVNFDALREVHLLIVACDEYDRRLLQLCNSICLQMRLRWTSGWRNDLGAYIGPSIIPFETACFVCLLLRTSANLVASDIGEAIRDREKQFATLTPVVSAAPNPVSNAIGALLALEALRLAVEPNIGPSSKLISLDLVTFEQVMHPVLKVPRCTACGSVANTPQPKLWSAAPTLESL